MTKKILVEGDATNFDQSVWARLVDMYMSFGLIYDDESHPDSESPVRKRLTQWLVKNLLVRVMHAFGPVWVEQKGGVPSGCQNTSHMDSWIMALWLFLFAVTQASKASPEIQKKIFDKLISGEIAFIVYGDDHVYSMSEDESLHPYLDGVNFRFFMQKYFNVEIRDLKTSTTFLSFAEGGRLVHVGMCFLKHYAVLNPYKDSHPNQPLTLPYRETKEYIAKAIIGRETVRTRTPFDVLLSSIGHAYNTYASNRDAYDKLLCLYQACKLSLDFKSDDDITNYFLQNYPLEIETYNKIGLTLQEIQAGFPSWETLIEQNRVDAEYHLTTFVNSRWSDRFSD